MGSTEDNRRVSAAIGAHGADLLAFLHRRTEAPDDAADMFSDLLLVLWRRAKHLPQTDLKARLWMFGIARKVLSSGARPRRRRTALHMRLQEQLRQNGSVERDRSGDVDEALARLHPLDREIVRLIHWDGFSQVEVGRLLGMTDTSVRRR